ncbi:hypothetical protein ACIBI3_09790 [Actinomadura luteofluorescens]|uniref:hypothetical protein n=1 Tax=Actinomadura luteofluorescens TaxID=46163 RepID=UPI00346F21A9
MGDALLLLFLQRLFPTWSIRLERGGVWRAEGDVHISASSREGLVGVLTAVDPDGVAEAVRVLEEVGR